MISSKHGLVIRFVAALGLLGVPVLVSAHPDLFIDPRVEIVGNGTAVEQIYVEWTFDTMYSASLFMDFPKPKTGKYEGKALAALKDGAFDNLKSFGYYLLITIDGTAFKIKTVSNFGAWVGKGNLVYGFDIQLPELATARSISVCMVDQENFAAFNDYVRERNHLIDLPESTRMEYGNRTIKTPKWGTIKPEEITVKLE